MLRTRPLVAGLAAVLLGTTATPRPSPARAADRAAVPAARDTMPHELPAWPWIVEARGVQHVGDYGDNMAYDGKALHPMLGRAELRLDPDAGRGKLRIEVVTTSESGPVRFSKDSVLSGRIRIDQTLDVSADSADRIVTGSYLHGDTGRGGPILPRVYAYLATWGPADIYVNGELAIRHVTLHTMLTDALRGAGHRIARDSTVYSPDLADKTGFDDPSRVELHVMAFTSDPDSANFPPQSGWLNLHFSSLVLKKKPADVKVKGASG